MGDSSPIISFFSLNWLNNHKWNKCPDSVGLDFLTFLNFFFIIILKNTPMIWIKVSSRWSKHLGFRRGGADR